MEQEVGAELFKRTSNGLKPSLAGEIYYESAQKIMELHRDMEKSIAQLEEAKYGKLTIGTTFFLSALVLPFVFQEFSHRFPNISLKIVEATSPEIQSEISRGLVDFGIVHLPVELDHLHVRPIGRERFLLAVPPEDAINEMSYTKDSMDFPYLDLKQVAKRPFILTHPEQVARQEANRICQCAGFTPQAKYVSKNLQTSARMVRAGLGFSLLPSSYLGSFGTYGDPNFYHLEEDLSPFWELGLITSKNLIKTESYQAFLEICQNILPEMYPY